MYYGQIKYMPDFLLHVDLRVTLIYVSTGTL